MSTTIWWTIAGCTVVTAVIKGIGPVALGGRDIPPRLTGVIELMAPALLAALVVTSTFAVGDQWHVGANTAGVAVGGIILVRRGPLLLAVVAAVAVTALLRAVT
ncbi:AzlD domain-containing protein [Aeromicrobium chenweiae]|uniref:Branched-chain amino acid ABC transporter n=1 Tax=Aeromicrobium chenweiae TaxID=2079793 RepID=A0A2S0WNS9_9ACTN|nr:AzlD domain-containing protein [Aeromicrobium chenweiae]AWB92966.1 branched-chain amino acid ABC transporter [Aeromicrobium chenweiae]TGN33959.1 AzlD domain-containing protein [Aeromicrobium chenweiae]